MRSLTFRKILAMTALAVAVCATSGCAFCDRDNRRLLSAMDEWVQPESTPARVALAPVAIPAATVAVAADIVVIHPVTQIPDAAEDTYELYWAPREMSPLKRTLLFLPCVALTPPTFVGDWIVRSVFDVD